MTRISSYGRKPSVFVSSTCYDLSQIRADIRDFLEQIGFEPILSEFDSFPIDPHIGTIDNCLRAVRERTDIFVLVIGGRYGKETISSKSVTNMEYITARSQNIPIYVFVNRNISSILSVWKKNPDGDYSDIVDTTKLFEFIEQIKNKENTWVFDFDNAKDITETLRKQFAYLFNDSLNLRKKINILGLSNKVQNLSGEALKIVINKEQDWEYKLFGTLLLQGIEDAKELRRDLKYGMYTGKCVKFENPIDIFDWMQEKNDVLMKLTDNLLILFNNALEEAFGKVGEPGDVDSIIYVADRFIEVYKSIIKIALDFKSVIIDEKWIKLARSITIAPLSLIEDIELYCENFNKEISKLDLIDEDSTDPIELDLTLHVRAFDLSEYFMEINTLREIYGIHD